MAISQKSLAAGQTAVGPTGGSGGVLFTDRRDFYIDPQVVKELWTDVTPFTTVISNRETRQTNDPLFKMFEHRNPWVKQYFLVNSDTDNLDSDGVTETTITIDGYNNLSSTPHDDKSYIGLVCDVWTDGYGAYKGQVVVTDTSSNTVIKTKSIKLASGSDTALADNDIFLVVGNAHGEGTYAPEPWYDELKVVWNSCQLFKTPLQVTGTLLQASLRGESSELARLRVQKSQEHKMQKERAFLFGKRFGGTGLADSQNDTTSESFSDSGLLTVDTGVGAGNVIRTTYGMVSALDDYGTTSGDYQNEFTISSSYSYGDFVDDMEKVFQYIPESGVKRAFCGAGALGYWSKISGSDNMAGNSGWTVNIGDMKRDALGFNYRVLETPHGILQLIPTPALRGPYNKYMVVVSEENMFHAQYRNPMYQTNIKTDNAFDGVKDQYFSDEGVGISLIDSHHLFKITA